MLTVLLPAAGFGKRNPDQPIKELMLNNDRPLIEYSFEHLRQKDASSRISKILIITRQEKRMAFELWLAKYRQEFNFAIPVYFHNIEPSGNEWPKSVLSSKGYWSEKNLVLLPDTKIDHSHLVQTIDDELEAVNSVWGITKKTMDELPTFGVVERRENIALAVTEKPRFFISHWVWGAFAFKNTYGKKLLEDLEKSTANHFPITLSQPSTVVELEYFDDLSRNQGSN